MNQLLDDLFRRTSGQIVATLTRILGARNLALAEEVAQDALIKALQIWPTEGVPANPSAWLIQVAKHRAVDLLRREQWLADRAAMLAALDAVGPHSQANVHLRGELSLPDDDQLAMMFLACHPILTREARVALTLKTVCGFGVAEIARALLSRDDAIAQRLVRAKRQLREADVRFEVGPDEYPVRLDSVLDAIYLLFNEGYAAHSGDDLIRGELCDEAIRLAAVLVEHSATCTPAVHALLALMLLQAARQPARIGDSSDLLLLAEQDRSRWDREMIARGLRHLDKSADGNTLTPYHIEAGIAVAHATAETYHATDWRHIVDLYDALIRIKPTPVVALNRAVALSRWRGPQAGLDALRGVVKAGSLREYYLLPATLGELSRESGDLAAARAHYRDALACRCSEPERRFLERRLAEVEDAASLNLRAR
jgi:RNA polymerase sigma-70 factor, ECF subfamily